ncbi:hypothetical protein BJ875DRAFT_438515 [Amylocarpus encephaloides]|uniref:Uncharacterized protein n=1 Tax=Amylocarpus encephaloides TaxID=45428 RepID=A0A9P7YP38_9HELO|nr:hypothetical protein BJ875DRAFT_438515 [Amylocarpus encephaloides]
MPPLPLVNRGLATRWFHRREARSQTGKWRAAARGRGQRVTRGLAGGGGGVWIINPRVRVPFWGRADGYEQEDGNVARCHARGFGDPRDRARWRGGHVDRFGSQLLIGGLAAGLRLLVVVGELGICPWMKAVSRNES